MTGSDPRYKHDGLHADDRLMDGMARSVKKMIVRGKERGYVTYDELYAALPPDQLSSEQITDTIAMLSEMGVAVTYDERAPLAPLPTTSDQGSGGEDGQVESMSDVPRADEAVVDADGLAWCLQYLDVLRRLDGSPRFRANFPMN